MSHLCSSNRIGAASRAHPRARRCGGLGRIDAGHVNVELWIRNSNVCSIELPFDLRSQRFEASPSSQAC